MEPCGGQGIVAGTAEAVPAPASHEGKAANRRKTWMRSGSRGLSEKRRVCLRLP